MTNKNIVQTSLIIVIAFAILGVGAIMVKKNQTPQTGSSAQVMSATITHTYKDGKYSAEGDYRSPGGPEQVKVSITLKAGTITDADVVSEATLPKSKHFQGLFISGYKPLVIGKKINEVQLDKVAGSSLTPKGFNDALAKIMTQAQS